MLWIFLHVWKKGVSLFYVRTYVRTWVHWHVTLELASHLSTHWEACSAEHLFTSGIIQCLQCVLYTVVTHVRKYVHAYVYTVLLFYCLCTYVRYWPWSHSWASSTRDFPHLLGRLPLKEAVAWQQEELGHGKTKEGTTTEWRLRGRGGVSGHCWVCVCVCVRACVCVCVLSDWMST